MTALEELQAAYGDLVALVEDLDETEQWTPTGCAGWCVRDLVFHLLGDAQRALVALATPAAGPPDTDAVTYWRAWQPGTSAAATALRMTRVAASAWSALAPLAALYAETARAVLHAAGHADLSRPVRTQGHVLTADDLLLTLVVEAALHHLDLVRQLDRPGPSGAALRRVRRTAEGLLGAPLPAGVDDATAARAATGRGPVPAGLAPEIAGALPLFG